jgi:hypothetical protein
MSRKKAPWLKKSVRSISYPQHPIRGRKPQTSRRECPACCAVASLVAGTAILRLRPTVAPRARSGAGRVPASGIPDSLRHARRVRPSSPLRSGRASVLPTGMGRAGWASASADAGRIGLASAGAPTHHCPGRANPLCWCAYSQACAGLARPRPRPPLGDRHRESPAPRLQRPLPGMRWRCPQYPPTRSRLLAPGPPRGLPLPCARVKPTPTGGAVGECVHD